MRKDRFPKYVKAYKRRGRWYAYYRRAGNVQRIEGEPFTAAWWAEYSRIHATFEVLPQRDAAPRRGTIDWLAVKYLASPEFAKLAPLTKRDYRKELDLLRADYGARSWEGVTTTVVVNLRNKFAAQPRKADKVLVILRTLAKVARLNDIRPDDPTAPVGYLYRSSGSWRAWDAIELEWFSALVQRRSIRLAFMLALFTGQRQSDVLAMRWGEIQDNVIMVVQEKTKAKVWIPLHPDLAAELEAAMPHRLGTVIAGKENGQQYSNDGFRTVWTRELGEMGLAGLTFHGLRKNAASALAEAGCSEHEIQSITGHKTTAMVGLYTREARQKEMAKSAINKWAGKKGPEESV